VGASDENDELCKFSSRGPTVDGRLKPDVAAPGMHIKSCWFNSSTSFFTISWTCKVDECVWSASSFPRNSVNGGHSISWMDYCNVWW